MNERIGPPEYATWRAEKERELDDWLEHKRGPSPLLRAIMMREPHPRLEDFEDEYPATMGIAPFCDEVQP